MIRCSIFMSLSASASLCLGLILSFTSPSTILAQAQQPTPDFTPATDTKALPHSPLPMPGFRKLSDPVIVLTDPFARSAIITDEPAATEEVTAEMIAQAIKASRVGAVFLPEPNVPDSKKNRVVINRQPYGVGSLVYADESLPPFQIERITPSAIVATMKTRSFILPVEIRPSFSNRATKVIDLSPPPDPAILPQ